MRFKRHEVCVGLSVHSDWEHILLTCALGEPNPLTLLCHSFQHAAYKQQVYMKKNTHTHLGFFLTLAFGVLGGHQSPWPPPPHLCNPGFRSHLLRSVLVSESKPAETMGKPRHILLLKVNCYRTLLMELFLAPLMGFSSSIVSCF